MAGKDKPGYDPKVEEEPKDEDEGAEGDAPETESPEAETETESPETEEEGKDEDKEEGDKDEDVEPKDIPVRQSVQQHIISRQKRTIKKLRSKKDEEGDELDETDDDALTPEAETAVSKEVKRQVAPILDQVVSTTDAGELETLYANEPEAKKYDKRIRAYMKNEHWKGVPVEAIFHHLAFKDAEATGASRKRIADKETALKTSAGRTLKPKKTLPGKMPSAEEIAGMSEKQFEKLQLDVQRGKYLPKPE